MLDLLRRPGRRRLDALLATGAILGLAVGAADGPSGLAIVALVILVVGLLIVSWGVWTDRHWGCWVAVGLGVDGALIEVYWFFEHGNPQYLIFAFVNGIFILRMLSRAIRRPAWEIAAYVAIGMAFPVVALALVSWGSAAVVGAAVAIALLARAAGGAPRAPR